jgi:hypothetical protein
LHGRSAGTFVGEVRGVEPVRGRSGEVHDAENEYERHREEERELHERLSLVIP